jgi:hypothetical protein
VQLRYSDLCEPPRNEADVWKAEEALERYFVAFEAGTMNEQRALPASSG